MFQIILLQSAFKELPATYFKPILTHHSSLRKWSKWQRMTRKQQHIPPLILSPSLLVLQERSIWREAWQCPVWRKPPWWDRSRWPWRCCRLTPARYELPGLCGRSCWPPGTPWLHTHHWVTARQQGWWIRKLMRAYRCATTPGHIFNHLLVFHTNTLCLYSWNLFPYTLSSSHYILFNCGSMYLWPLIWVFMLIYLCNITASSKWLLN